MQKLRLQEDQGAGKHCPLSPVDTVLLTVGRGTAFMAAGTEGQMGPKLVSTTLYICVCMCICIHV